MPARLPSQASRLQSPTMMRFGETGASHISAASREESEAELGNRAALDKPWVNVSANREPRPFIEFHPNEGKGCATVEFQEGSVSWKRALASSMPFGLCTRM